MKKITELTWSEILDLVSKYMGRIKTISILLLVLLFSFSSIMSGCNKQRAQELFEKVTGLSVENDLLLKQVKSNEKEIYSLNLVKDSLDRILAQKEKMILDLDKELSKLKKENTDLKGQILIIPVEESYNFLQTVAYPFRGEKRFPFNEPQVKGIHLSYLENNNLKLQNENLIFQIDEYKEKNLLSLQKLKAEEEKFSLASRSIERYEEMTSNNQEIQNLLQEENKKLQRRNKWLKRGTIGGTALGLLTGFFIAR